MSDSANTRPLSDFQNNPEEHIRRLRESGEPEVLTINGRAEVVVEDAAAYRKLLEALDWAEATAVLHSRLATINTARPLRKFLEDFARSHNVDLNAE